MHFDRLAEVSKGNSGLVLLSAPGAGLSEILRATFDRLFNERGEILPFYFEIRESDRTAKGVALRFMSEFMLHAVAFRRRDTRILDISPQIGEIADLASPDDGYWIDRLVDSLVGGNGSSEPRSWVRNCLAAPLRAAASGARPFVIFDNAHVAFELEEGQALFEDICGIYGRGKVPFALGGNRRSLYAKTTFETMHVEPFSFAEAGDVVEKHAGRLGVEINDQTRDLIAVQLGGNAGGIVNLLASAAYAQIGLTSFDNVQKVYGDEIFGGRISRDLDDKLEAAVPGVYQRERVLWLINENLNANASRVPASYWERHGNRVGFDASQVLARLHENEIVNVSNGSVDIDSDNIALCDYLRARSTLEIDRRPRGLAVGEAISGYVKRAPQLMARFYRKSSALPLRSLMTSFDGRKISPAFFDYARFKEEFKGAEDEKILKALKGDNSSIELPQTVYTAATSSFYPALSEVCDPERSAGALGFLGKEPVAWLAVQFDSKLEATRELASFWCDRLEMAAVNAEFDSFRLWLIAPEGFSPDAMEMLAERGAYGSSRKQVELLSILLGADLTDEATPGADEYEVVVPMGEDTEMIAAYTLEEIAKRHDFPQKAINQIKTALVEACINAAEHSLSPDRRTHQRFVVEPDRITITVQNRGLRLADKENTPTNEDRRGWGLKLMRSLMNEVTVERTDDGTKITMVKIIDRTGSDNADPAE
jgi:serine/threonine-protein kinase RsbW